MNFTMVGHTVFIGYSIFAKKKKLNSLCNVEKTYQANDFVLSNIFIQINVQY